MLARIRRENDRLFWPASDNLELLEYRLHEICAIRYKGEVVSNLQVLLTYLLTVLSTNLWIILWKLNAGVDKVKATIICDNETWAEGILADQGFTCLVEAYEKLKIQNLRFAFK
ncbi:MAG: hypothetical protein ABIA63_12620 [bacterium]